MASGENQQGDGAGRLLAGRYRVQEQLGRGGMGIVWRAVDEVLGRPVAVKELRTFTDAAATELAALRTRMQREARAAARVRHTGVIAVHDVAEVDGRPLIVMELVDGPSLDDVLRERGTLPPREAAAIGAKVMEALAAAHQAGVLHRDVKPGNVLLERGGRVVLTDFGIAMVDDPGDGNSTNLTRSGELVGSLDYLAPERAQGHEPGPASDIWALGATLYGTVEGNAPFRRTSTWSTLTAIVSEPLPAPVQAGPLAPVLQQLMAKDPQARPDAETAVRLLTAVAESDRDDDTTVLRPGARPTPGVPPVHGAPTVGSGGFPVTPSPVGGGPQSPHGPYEPGPFAAHGADTPGGSDTPLVTPVPGAPAQRGRRRTLIVAAAVLAVLAAGGGGYVWLAGGDGKRVEAGGSGGPNAPEYPSKEAGPSASGKPEPTEQGANSPSPSSSSPDGSEDKPDEDASKPAGDGGTTSGGSDGGADGGSDGGSSTGGDSGGTSGGSGGASGGSGSSGSSGGGGEPAPVCHPAGGGKYNCDVWRTADSYTASGAKAGVLNAGTNYFYCQQNLGRRETYQGWTNVWWAKTDDDSGNTNVFVSDVYIKGGENDKPLPGLPVC
ncbi:serine/threonine-protein kinase [Streptomyces luteolus]|uniref:non-specific serine/threonine protein kinase n=1 Tax=Streptomyces luteolus TaxID=3043615 RepID=A0ABT6SRK3_9ACTN|nr:serine/threonine-protein kinase [Streptomyces sp. B-S-A12]MDI3418234.1 protein kinase [Streptomyces sp. B-S-A12]